MLLRCCLRFVAALCTTLVLAKWPNDPAGAETYLLTGNARFQRGNELPIPVTLAPSPQGRVEAVSGAYIQQSFPGGGVPPKIVLPAGQLTAPAVSLTLPVYLANPNVFELHSSIPARFPRSDITFQASGRTGAAVQTFSVPNVGLVRYQRLVNQFGGPARPAFGGFASAALRGGAGAPCTGPPSCIVAFLPNTPLSAFGGPFGFMSSQALSAPSPGAFFASVGPAGTIFSLQTPLGPGVSQTRTSFAGPWTTGMITVSAPGASPPALFVLSGHDGRTPGGLGTISLVSGGLVKSSFEGVNGTRGWLNLTIVPEPAALGGLVAGLAMLVLLRLRVRRGRSPTRRPADSPTPRRRSGLLR